MGVAAGCCTGTGVGTTGGLAVAALSIGLSVPDAEMLISVSEALETPVSTLLGETVVEKPAEDLKAIAEKLEVINRQLAKRKRSKWKALYWLLLSLAVILVVFFVFLAVVQSPYLNWNFNDPETAIAGTVLHAFEYLFVRTAPFVFIGTVMGIVFVRRNYRVCPIFNVIYSTNR